MGCGASAPGAEAVPSSAPGAAPPSSERSSSGRRRLAPHRPKARCQPILRGTADEAERRRAPAATARSSAGSGRWAWTSTGRSSKEGYDDLDTVKGLTLNSMRADLHNVIDSPTAVRKLLANVEGCSRWTTGRRSRSRHHPGRSHGSSRSRTRRGARCGRATRLSSRPSSSMRAA